MFRKVTMCERFFWLCLTVGLLLGWWMDVGQEHKYQRLESRTAVSSVVNAVSPQPFSQTQLSPLRVTSDGEAWVSD